jgi:hypothetical protein
MKTKFERINVEGRRVFNKGVAMIFCWGGPDFKPQTDDT